ncbi:ATPase [Novosphingobium sp. 9]|uniref:ATPase n=1 Tax=Novosphingobium sp. 9 TaxID=2025349 RepID=UPI0021B66892|nr:ATPase [Novosphingobium sp. 9]
MRQIPLPLPTGADQPTRIVVGAANIEAVDSMMRAEHWPFRTAMLSGPVASGKSLLARWFVESGQGDAIDDAPDVPEDAVFHAWNRAQESGRPLLIVSAELYGAGEGHWNVKLPDLRSRLGAALQLQIGAPDDEMLADLIEVHAEARGLALDHASTAYLAGRAERSHLGARQLVEVIDRLSLERKQPPTQSILRDALAEVRGQG